MKKTSTLSKGNRFAAKNNRRMSCKWRDSKY